jgi:nucleotide-binding universal stress UspA family protein
VSSPRTIAVGFDRSPGAEAALRWALGAALPLGATVVVVHAVGLLEHRDQAEGSQDGAAIERRVVLLASEAGVPAGSVRTVMADGDPCSVLLRAAAAPISADLLVVGSRGQGAHAGRLLGSTSHELAEHTTVPVVIVPGPPVDPADPAG